ncbi:hypothetical protein M758_UG333800 [Ceratodon purpureus]|nr:hypothetical protein M758_UG333800 [Ceratodon purpureus]
MAMCSLQDNSADSASHEQDWWSDELLDRSILQTAYKDAIAQMFAFGATMLNQVRQQQSQHGGDSPSQVLPGFNIRSTPATPNMSQSHGPYGNLISRGATPPLRHGAKPHEAVDTPIRGPSPSETIPRQRLHLLHFAPPGSTGLRAPLGGRTHSSSQSDGSCGVSDMSQSVDNSDRNKRRREQRSYEPAFFKETVASDVEGRKPKHCIPTNPQGKIVGLRTKWHDTCRFIAKRLINWNYKSYAKHQGEWQLLCLTVQRELDTLFSYNPTDLDPEYLPKYLNDAIAHDKST